MSERLNPKGRPVGGTEYSWCRAVPGGTGITVAALLLSKPPDFSLLQNALHKLQITHPILRSKLHFDTTGNTYSFITSPTPDLQIQPFDLSSTSQILQTLSSNPNNSSISPFHLIFEHELNLNPWCNLDHSSNTDTDVLFASVYTLSDDKWAVMLRLHTAACDRTAAMSLLRELQSLMGVEREGEGIRREIENEAEVSLGIEDCIPSGKANKPFWARGVDMLGYSLNSFRLTNLNFRDVDSPRSSEVVRLQMNSDDTDRILSGCKSRGIKLCGALAAAGLIATRSSNCVADDQREKYAVVTLIDCRSILDPVLSSNHPGFYHSAILNTHDVRGEKLWELAPRTYTSFANAKDSNKHFSDMADLNFLMCKAIDNPGLTPSSSFRTSLISVFEEPVIDHSNELQRGIGLEDYMGCGSVHGVGPSIAIFHTVRDGQLDCACVYPSPLHSREQMQELVDEMKRVLVDC
uniref:Condensation domain-containing protein n=1 Tax=Davidia involucrata TaxID=16924 RepID=A0A5B7AJD2_DAVIN